MRVTRIVFDVNLFVSLQFEINLKSTSLFFPPWNKMYFQNLIEEFEGLAFIVF